MTLPANAGQAFTDQDDATIRTMHKAKASVTEIAVALQRTEKGIAARLERLGLRRGKVAARQAAFLASL